MGKDIDLMQAVRDEDLSLLQKLLDRSRAQRSSKCVHRWTLSLIGHSFWQAVKFDMKHKYLDL